MKNVAVAFLLTLNLSSHPSMAANGASTLKAFETDYCTLFVDGTVQEPGLWKHCCVEHDLRYWFGGSTPDMDTADLRLRSCVEKVAGKTWAAMIYRGVRTGHYSPIKNKYAWGWAWSTKRKLEPLTSSETEYVISELKQLHLEEINIDDFINANFPQLNVLTK